MSLFARSRPIFFQACFGRSSAKPHVCVTRCFMDGDFSAEDFLESNYNHRSSHRGRIGVHQRYRNKKQLHEYLYGRSVCQIVLENSKRPIFKLHASNNWQHAMPKDKKVASILYKAAERHIPITYTSHTNLFRLSEGRPHQGVCLEAGLFVPLQADLNSMLAEPVTGRLPLWVLLDEVKDPMNVGAILRTSHFLGVDKVILSPQCASITSTVSKASSGASEIIPIYSLRNTPEFVQGLFDAKWDVIGTDSLKENDNHKCHSQENDNEVESSEIVSDVNSTTPIQPSELSDFRLTKPTILVLGSEGFGISENIKRSFTKLLSIQSNNHNKVGMVSCLNVSAAAAILLYKLTEKR